MTQSIKKSYGTPFKCFSTNQNLNGTRLTLSQYVFEQLEICFKSHILVRILIDNSYKYDKFYYLFTKADSRSSGLFLKWPLTLRARRQILLINTSKVASSQTRPLCRLLSLNSQNYWNFGLQCKHHKHRRTFRDRRDIGTFESDKRALGLLKVRTAGQNDIGSFQMLALETDGARY